MWRLKKIWRKIMRRPFKFSMPTPLPYDDAVEWDGRCPECGGYAWSEGPAGGMSVNLLCGSPGCDTWVNHTPMLGIAHRIRRKG